MGKVKIKKKSTFIDMTAMSDVTVLLLTFFMLTSTFLQKEPTIVYTPSSVSEEKVPVANLVTVLVSSADKTGKKENPTASEGKIFLSFAGDSILSTGDFRKNVLLEAVKIYNEQHPNSQIAPMTDAQVAAFQETNMMGTPFKNLGEVLSMETGKRDELMSDLENPLTGIPINDNKDKDKNFNDFQVWCRAIYKVAQDTHNKKGEDGLSEDDLKKLEDFYNALTKDGKGVAIKADKDTPFTVIQQVFDNLQTMKLNKFSLLTALTSEEEAEPTPNK